MENRHLKYMKIINNFLKKQWVLMLILVLAAVLRLWQLGTIPPHLAPDEAALGYNAYSILKTGKDEWGQTLPIIFKSFGDYKPGFYIYLTVPFVAALGLNESAVRLPSALCGILSVLLIYLIVGQLFNNKKLSLISAFVAAITPWLVFFSRGAWEVNVSLTLTLLGIYFFLKFLHNSSFIISSSICFALTFITYQGAKLSTAIVVLLLVILYWQEFKKLFTNNLRIIILSAVLSLVIVTPILLGMFQGQAKRLTVFSLFSYTRPKEVLEPFLEEGKERVGSLSYYLFHSEKLDYFRGILTRYFNHFSPRFLFWEGDWANPRHSSPYQGALLLSDVFLLIAGFVVLIREKIRKETLFVWLWLFLAPLPSILSRDQIHAIRAFNLVIPLVIILSLGLNFFVERIGKIKNLLARIIICVLGISIYLFAFIYYLDSYFVHLSIHDSKYWNYGYKQIVETVTPLQKDFREVRIQQSFAQPYIYFLFFQKYDPAKYQKQAKFVESENEYDVGYIEHLDNIYFGPIDWSVNRERSDILFVADPITLPIVDSNDSKLFKLIREIRYLDNKEIAFRIIQIYKR
jgi:4-amino-4-deoxy-L-arabinose transferase-like glycosyltransferase